MEVKFSMIVSAAEIMNTYDAQVEFAQIPVKYYKDKYIDQHLWNYPYANVIYRFLLNYNFRMHAAL